MKLIEHFWKKNGENSNIESSNVPVKTTNKKMGKLTRGKFIIGMLGISAFLLCVCVYMILDTFAIGTAAAVDSFDEAKEGAEEDVYQQFYNKSYEIAKKKHQVENDISIVIENVEEEQKLEVLKVSEVTYEIAEPKDKEKFEDFITGIIGFFDKESIFWLEVPGNGVFTVDLEASEFIVDEERQYVLIRVPSPELTHFTIDYKGVELLAFEKGGAFKDSAKCGEDKVREQLQNAESTMKHSIKNNQEFYKSAKTSAESMLVNLVKELNPHKKDLVVEVEFID